MEESHSKPQGFSNTVIATLEKGPQVDAAVDELNAAGLDTEVLSGEPGRSHLDDDAEAGPVAKLRQLARTLGHETEILHHLDTVLAEGGTIISVDVESDQASLAATILERHNGQYLWRFGDSTVNRIGTGDEDDEEREEE
jgi:hypothetical protein